MSEPTTLAQYLDWLDETDEACLLRRILYGTDEPCPVCDGTGYDPPDYPCLFCHGRCRLKTPGLVERIDRAQRGDDDGVPLGYIGAIRHEIGETV